MCMNRERAHLRRADAWKRADQQGSKAVTSPQRGWASRGSAPGLGPHNPYRLALFRFAQYAFSRFDMAFLAAALIGARFRFCVAVG